VYEGAKPVAVIRERTGDIMTLSRRPALKAAQAGKFDHLAEKISRKIDLTWSVMWINIAIKSHIIEVRYENHSDDT
jgi:hypothetical protein